MDMDENQQCLLLMLPAELRQHIYTFLFDDGGGSCIAIRNGHWSGQRRETTRSRTTQPAARRSTKYHVMERTSMFHQRCYETTYHLASEHVEFHTAIMAVCRLLYGEASAALYGRHSFDFGHHVQAVVPFLTDRTPYTLSLVSCICVYKRGPFPYMGCTSEKSEWSCMCRFLSGMNTLERLRVVMETGRPSHPWEGVQELSASDIRLLSLIGHESLEWVRELAQVKTLKELELVSEAKYLPVPKSSAMAVYAALSVSVEHGLVEFLKLEMAKSCITSSVLTIDGASS